MARARADHDSARAQDLWIPLARSLEVVAASGSWRDGAAHAADGEARVVAILTDNKEHLLNCMCDTCIKDRVRRRVARRDTEQKSQDYIKRRGGDDPRRKE
jgi:hypothetical protein